MIKEFKEFIMRGNVVDLAVGVIVGAAFQGIVKSLCDDVISPFLGIFGGMNFDQMSFTINGAVISYGKFLTAVINFLIMAFIVFSIIKAINAASARFEKKEEPKAPTEKEYPYCKTKIAVAATRCPNCTSML